MSERPILFCADMVRSILDGRKTQTRRIVNSRISPIVHECFKVNGKWCNHTFGYELGELCPYGIEGDRLWVRETFMPDPYVSPLYVYRATEKDPDRYVGHKWKPSVFMPRKASRITLEITGVRVEQLQDISRGDCMSEGCQFPNIAISQPNATDPKKWYSELWESINGVNSWATNPYVWVVTFKKL